ncbi:MAG: glycine cleavage system aminomethyltransferase GcvT [Candidatus Omnitrophica bacterium]|nr:glycine cleavage system aminomethyltransferase GcvT [Candidatus Omnitrophota bacterium]
MTIAKNDLKRTPLYNKHLALGAKMVPFSGWEMPLQYTGIIDEHIHTRTKAGLFDVSHMGEFFLSGSSASSELDKLVTCRVDDMLPGKCRYGFLLNENGGIIDDLIVFKISQKEFKLVVNAGTSEKAKEWILDRVSSKDIFRDESKNIVKLDLQGPLSAKVINELIGTSVTDDLKRYWFKHIDLVGERVLFSRTGYTGELGYELFFPVSAAEKLWDALLSAKEVKPIGLGARDTLRLEMGYALYGSDIDENHTPLESNLNKFVFMEKDFIGKPALLRQKENGLKRILKGFIADGRRSARCGFKVLSPEGERIGEVTSAAFSPCLKKGIGLCYIKKEFAVEGRQIILTDGKTEIKATIESTPFYKQG